MKLTEHLLNLEPEKLEKATHHPFLKQVGELSVKSEHLKSWLIQDRYYTGGYVKMMGVMISRLSIYNDQREVEDKDASYSEDKAKRVLQTLSYALSNIYRETQFFTEILNREPYKKCVQPEGQKPWTARYVEFVKKVAHESGYDLGEALVVLWAMEVVFYRAWNYAKKANANSFAMAFGQTTNVHTETCKELMTNWTMEEFKEFVDACAFLVDELDSSDARRVASFEKVFRDILDLEVDFWNMAYD